MEQEINLDEITDMNLLQNLLDQTEDIDDRKAIRGRIQELRAIERAKRDEKLARLTNTREEMLLERQRKATEHKQRTLAMYDQMAKSAPAGGKKKMDIGIYTTGHGTPPTSPTVGDSDGVEDVLQQCKRSAEERKRKILEAYNTAARSTVAGDVKEMDAAQEFIKQRQQEAEDDKRRLLKAYDYVSKQGAGPKQVVLEELKRCDVTVDMYSDDPRFKNVGTASFGDGTSK